AGEGPEWIERCADRLGIHVAAERDRMHARAVQGARGGGSHYRMPIRAGSADTALEAENTIARGQRFADLGSRPFGPVATAGRERNTPSHRRHAGESNSAQHEPPTSRVANQTRGRKL